jgi:hypothetical protein
MKVSIVLLLTLGTLAGCSPRPTTSPAAVQPDPSQIWQAKTTELRDKLKAVTVSDGISKSEAELIAECYFCRNVGCGEFSGIRDGGDYWIVDGAFGYAGTPIQGFQIDKRTGKITSPVGPSYATPFEIFQ